MMKPERLDLEEILLGDQSSEPYVQMVEKIRQEALFVYPTDTIYGIGGIVSDRVREKIYQAKKRKPGNPLILIAGNVTIFSENNVVLNKRAELLAEAFWPGNLTLILPVAGSSETVAVRVSDHPFLQRLAQDVRMPLFSTSANISGTKYVNDPETIYYLFSDSIDFMVDAGILPTSSPSTVVDVSRTYTYTIVREGAVSSDAVRTILDK